MFLLRGEREIYRWSRRSQCSESRSTLRWATKTFIGLEDDPTLRQRNIRDKDFMSVVLDIVDCMEFHGLWDFAIAWHRNGLDGHDTPYTHRLYISSIP